MNRSARILRPFAALLCLLACTVHATDVSAPVTLIATERLAGSAYRETVLIAVPRSNGEHIGFIVNRPTEVTLAALFPERAASRKVADPVYLGGPVFFGSLFAVVRQTPEAGSGAIPLMPGLVLVIEASAVERVIDTMPNDARYITGLYVWEPGELAEQIRAGFWELQPADPGTVFRVNPADLWRDLQAARTERAPG